MKIFARILHRLGVYSNTKREPETQAKETQATESQVEAPILTPFPTLDPETVENSEESDSENGRVTEVNRKTLNLESNENDPWGAALKEDDEWILETVTEGGQFDRQGVQAGDKIIGMNGVPIYESMDFRETFQRGEACEIVVEQAEEAEDDQSDSSGICISLDALFSGALIGGDIVPSDNEEGFVDENGEKISRLQAALNDLRLIAEKSLVIEMVSCVMDEINSRLIVNFTELITDSSFTCHMTDKWITLRACFHTPESLPEYFMYKVMNTWNCNRRFSRMYLDDDNDLMLQAEIPASSSGSLCPQPMMRKILWSFFIAIIDHQRFMVAEISEKPETSDLEAHTTAFVCDEAHLGDKCVLCLDNFQAGDKCIRLRCNHVFHQDEIMKHLYNNPGCPICRTNFRG